MARRRSLASLLLTIIAFSFIKSRCDAAFNRPQLFRRLKGTKIQEAVAETIAEATDRVIPVEIQVSANNQDFVFKGLRRELLAEFLSTAFLVQLCTGAGFASTFLPDVSVNGIAVTIIAVTIAASMTASISGAHLNPAVSLAFALVRPTEKFGLKKVIPYSIAQLLGAMLGSSINVLMFSGFMKEFQTSSKSSICIECAKVFGCNFFHPVTELVAFGAEAFGTAALVFAIFALTHPKNELAMRAGHVPGLVALTVGGICSIIGPITQAGFNPARDFGPRLAAMFVAGYSKEVAFLPGWWVYLLAPMVGAPLGAALSDKLLFQEYHTRTGYDPYTEGLGENPKESLL